MRRMILVFGALGVLCAGPVQAAATSYSGRLSVTGAQADGVLIAGGDWNDPATSLHWTVDNTTTPGQWHYMYTLEVPTGGISHLIVEASDADPGPVFLLGNLFNPASAPDGWIASPIDIQLHEPEQGNPGMPQSMYGIKFDGAHGFDETTLTIEFDSDRQPVWGDFYAKGGGENMLYNGGFSDPDPLLPPCNMSIGSHVLVPDSMTAVVPAPGAMLLGGVGTVLVGWLGRKKLL